MIGPGVDEPSLSIERNYVLSDAGKHSYDVGRRLLEHAGLEGALNQFSSDACRSRQAHNVDFTLHLPSRGSIEVYAEGTTADVEYTHAIGNPINLRNRTSFVTQHELLMVLGRLCHFEKYGLVEVRPSTVEDPIVKISVESANRQKLERFATFIGHADWLISAYMGKQ